MLLLEIREFCARFTGCWNPFFWRPFRSVRRILKKEPCQICVSESATNVDRLYLKTFSHPLLNLGLLEFLAVLKIQKVAGLDYFVCVLFGRNIESLRDNTPWTTPCICHAICVEGCMALAAATAVFHGIDPKTSFLICEGLLFAWWMCGIYTGLARQSLQKKYHLKNSPRDPCRVHRCMHWCALCQEHREMKGRLSDNFVMPMTVVNPPPVQEMSSSNENSDSSPPSGTSTNLEMQPL
ncbi:cell number regulator 6-like [Hibiscus syriacus]|uniref:cell number regulator 6-like n=1 Tax=Hibiscus syriacus TaxID=106335 RepID=UPI001923F868|nr:cell number regulator 6-like [Hibiscus syriacus]